jgi:hypothetical protein
MAETLAFASPVLVRAIARVTETPFDRPGSWGVRFDLADSDDGVRDITVYRERAGTGRPPGLEEDVLKMLVTSYLNNPTVAWTPLARLAANELGVVTRIAAPGDAEGEAYAVVVRLAMTVPDAVVDAPRLILRDLMRQLNVPADLAVDS